MPQSEDPMYTHEQFKEVIGREPAMLSGGKLHAFREGWALKGYGKAHYFTRCKDDISYVQTKCGLHTEVTGLLGAGTWEKCKRCQKKVNN